MATKGKVRTTVTDTLQFQLEKNLGDAMNEKIGLELKLSLEIDTIAYNIAIVCFNDDNEQADALVELLNQLKQQRQLVQMELEQLRQALLEAAKSYDQHYSKHI